MPPDAPRTRLYRHSVFIGHDTTPHPENPSRIVEIDAELTRRGLLEDRSDPVWEPASDEVILRVHDASILATLERLTARGGGQVDPDTIVLADSFNATRHAAGAAIDAIDSVLADEITRAFILGRPPGHHATSSQMMGFCLLNTVAIAAGHAKAMGVDQIAIIDWDVHHGNGTQDIFYDRDDVLYCSIHQYGDIFPGTGAATERGTGRGTGYTLNVPLRSRSAGSRMVEAMREAVSQAVREFRPELILVSAGYDAHTKDPLGGIDATDDDFRQLMTLSRQLADDLCEGKLVAVLEGGYAPSALARCVADSIEILDATTL